MWEKTEGGRCGSPGGGKVETPEGGSRLESPEGSVVGARSGHELAHARHAPPGMRKLMPSPRRAWQEPAHARQRACGQQTSKRQGMRHGKQPINAGAANKSKAHDMTSKTINAGAAISAWAGSRQGGWLNVQALWAAVLRWFQVPQLAGFYFALRPFSLLLQTSSAHQVLHCSFSYCTAVLRASVRKFCCKECTRSLLQNFFATRLYPDGQKRLRVPPRWQQSEPFWSPAGDTVQIQSEHSGAENSGDHFRNFRK